MNKLVAVNPDGSVLVSTEVIAAGTNNEHKAVIQLVRSYQSDLEEFGRVTFEMSPFETNGGTQYREIAKLNEDQSTLLLALMRNSSVVVRFKVSLVKEFSSLKKQASDPMQVLADPAAMRGLLLTYTEKVIELEQKVEKIQPMADALIRIAHSDGGVNLTTAAKVLHQKPKHFIASLAARGWIYKRPGSSSWCGYQDILNRGYVDHKVTTIERNDGSEKSVVQCLVTPKGIAKLSMIFGVQSDMNGGM